MPREGFVLFIPAETPMLRLLAALLVSVTFLIFTLIARPYKKLLLYIFSVACQVGLGESNHDRPLNLRPSLPPSLFAKTLLCPAAITTLSNNTTIVVFLGQ